MILRQSRYPLIDGSDDTIASLVPHTDSGFMTLLPPNKVQACRSSCPMGAGWTRGRRGCLRGERRRHPAPLDQRAVPVDAAPCANVSGTLRYAIPFFCDPDHDTVIECLPSCQSADNPPKYPPIKFGDYALWFAAQRYHHMAKVETPSEAQVARARAPPPAGRVDSMKLRSAVAALLAACLVASLALPAPPRRRPSRR